MMGPPTRPDEVIFVRSARARHYRLSLRRDGAVVATIPAGGNEQEAMLFAERQRNWLERAKARQARRPRPAEVWTAGTVVLWRGEPTPIRVITGDPLRVCLAADVFTMRNDGGDLRAGLEAQFARRAKIELPARAWELAAETNSRLKQVTVRNQRSRWGSCSANGTVSLNWRLIQAPENVRDYIIYHELMHLREMNHSERFWRAVEQVCPEWRAAERWLKHHAGLVGL